jgi:hypothetical protein
MIEYSMVIGTSVWGLKIDYWSLFEIWSLDLVIYQIGFLNLLTDVTRNDKFLTCQDTKLPPFRPENDPFFLSNHPVKINGLIGRMGFAIEPYFWIDWGMCGSFCLVLISTNVSLILEKVAAGSDMYNGYYHNCQRNGKRVNKNVR